MNRSAVVSRLVVGLMIAVMVLSGTSTTTAQSAPPSAPDAPRPVVDRLLGEEEQIERRLEWFFSTRTAGTSSADERAKLRRDGVKQTQQALELQRALRADRGAEPQNPWVPKGPSPSAFGGWSFGNVAGRVTALAGDWTGGILYLGTAAGGLWSSNDEGQSWTQLFDAVGTMTIGAVTVDPNDPNVIWAGTGDNAVGCESYFGVGLMRSADAGQTWEARNGSGANTLDDLSSFANVIVDPRDSNHLVVGGRIRNCTTGSSGEGGIHTTTDGGLNWTARLSSKQVYEIAQDPSSMDLFWAATDDGIYKSSDNGVSWLQQTASGLPFGNVGRCELALAPSASGTVYALFASGPQLWRTTDGGTTWTQQVFGSNACDGQCSYNMVLRVHRTDPDIVYRGTVRSFKSVNGGVNWTDLTGGWGSGQKVHQDTHVMVMHPTDVDTYYTGTDGGLWKSVNGGSSFSNLNGNLNTFLFYAVGVSGQDTDTICGGAQDNSSVARASSSDQWSLQAVTGDGFTCHFNPQDDNYAYITSYPNGGLPSVRRSTSGAFGGFSGISGTSNGIIANDRINWVTPYLIDPVNPNVLYLGTHRIYRSDNFGSNWTQMGPDLTANSGSLINIGINRNFSDTLLTASGSGRVWRSIDGAANWTDITTGLPARSVNDVASDPLDPDRAFAVVGGFNTDHVWEWTAAGGWTPRSTGLPNVPHNTVLMITSDDILVGNDVGVYRSFDGGQTWVPWMDSLPLGVPVTDLKYNLAQSILTAGTYGRGAWQTALGQVSPILLRESASAPVEIDGNGNSLIEPGETWGVSLALRNGGGANALGTQGTATTTATGITLLNGGQVGFGDIAPGAVKNSTELMTFIVDTSATCGDDLVFELLNLTTSNDPGPFSDIGNAFVSEIGGFLPPVSIGLIDDDLDPAPDAAWTHLAVDAGQPGCAAPDYIDEWKVTSKDAAHGSSYHAGRGPGMTYLRKNYAWLNYAGMDSTGGAGLTISATAVSATLTISHWYDTSSNQDGGVVLLDAVQDGADNYTLIQPIGGYPAGTLGSGDCNGLEGLQAFQGSSGGWVTSTFDLTAFKGNTVHLAFVFGSDSIPDFHEGWYIDDVSMVVEELGAPTCNVVNWPGTVQQDVMFSLTATTTIEASWADSCNIGVVPAQEYAIHAGDLDLLRATGSYNHTPVDGLCNRSSPSSFDYSGGLQYFLVLPNDGTREGGAGTDSQGNPRVSLTNVCGESRADSCN